MTNSDYELFMLALTVWRESRGEPLPAKVGVAWTIRNRVIRPSWWGKTWVNVVLCPEQFSCYNRSDPNSTKFPLETDSSWADSMSTAQQVYQGIVSDPTGGADHYFSGDGTPSWVDGATHLCDIGVMHFYRTP